MSTRIESFEHNGRKVAIYFDDDARSPRGEDRDCNLATLVCWHRRRNLGDEQIEGMTEAELRERVTERGVGCGALLRGHQKRGRDVCHVLAWRGLRLRREGHRRRGAGFLLGVLRSG